MSKSQAMSSNHCGILLIGALPPPIGGASISFSGLVTELNKVPDFDVITVNTSRNSLGGTRFKNALKAIEVVWQIFVHSKNVDLFSFHASSRGLALFGPIIYLVSRALNKPLIVRQFGGALDIHYEHLIKPFRLLLRTTYFRSEIFLLETRHLVSIAPSLGVRNVEWFSNHRDGTDLSHNTPYKEICRNLIYLGHITPCKGIDVMFESLDLINPNVNIDLYGPITSHEYNPSQLNELGGGRIRYKGVVEGNQVAELMWGYDALVIPTNCITEGYPGVILEAYAHGLPVISTKLRAIPEIVDFSTGILVEPENAVAFANAVNKLHSDRDLYIELQQGVRERFHEFSQESWTKRFVELCREVVEYAAR